ncbi:M42 family metallopeptidase [Candidatus Hepatoplasma crinochetorum]|uniref:M42 family metallopeptidase n=1 Tax=Candidatus Hepatoplasma crinochetorum TaxID=295596 RepID=UPI003089F3C5|nr:MAG: M42 family metallopeptidase [Candidatus Hepatoplasma crinochetorum]
MITKENKVKNEVKNSQNQKQTEKIKVSSNLLRNAIDLSNLNGISSREEGIVDYLKKEFKSMKNIIIERDGLGSVAFIKKGKKDHPIISFTTHMDEVGFMITNITKDGFLNFSPIGGWWSHVLLGQLLRIITEKNKSIIGVVGSKPPHLLTREEAQKVLPIKSLFIDIGAKSKEDVLSLGINIGDQVVPYQTNVHKILNDRLIGKAFDNRISIATGIEIMHQIANKELEATVIFICSTQEEVGLRGAKTSSYKWTPDIAFAVDVTIANDTPGLILNDTKLGSGPALSLFDSSILANPNLFQKIKEIAEKNNINYTIDSLTGGGTDAGTIHLTKNGVITMTISIPSRYMHSHNSIIDLKDAQKTADLIVKILNELTLNTINNIKYK